MVDQIIPFFNQVYDKTYARVIGYVIAKCGRTSDIPDIVQEVYLEFYRVLRKRGLRYVANNEAFLLKLAKAKVYRHYTLMEKVKHHLPLTGSRNELETVEPADLDCDIAESSINGITIKEVWGLLKGKPQPVQKIFYLYYYCGLKLKEIGTQLNMHESSVKHKLYRTLREIRVLYTREGSGE